MLGRTRKTALLLLATALAVLAVTTVTATSRPDSVQQSTSSANPKIIRGTYAAASNPVAIPHDSLEAISPRDSAITAVAHAAAAPTGSNSASVSYPAKDTPSDATAPSDSSGPGPPDPPSDPWVIEEARRTVEDNAPALEQLCDGVVADIASGNLDAVKNCYAPDETAGDPLGSVWPPLLSTTALSTVNVYLAGDSLVYFTYALVTWSDAGITSEHTVCIPMRFIDGAWYLTTIDDTTDGLEFVTSVQM